MAFGVFCVSSLCFCSGFSSVFFTVFSIFLGDPPVILQRNAPPENGDDVRDLFLVRGDRLRPGSNSNLSSDTQGAPWSESETFLVVRGGRLPPQGVKVKLAYLGLFCLISL